MSRRDEARDEVDAWDDADVRRRALTQPEPGPNTDAVRGAFVLAEKLRADAARRDAEWRAHVAAQNMEYWS